MLFYENNSRNVALSSVIFRILVRGYISNSGENYNLFEVPADKPKTITKK
ncbi:hypothetical protein EMIT036CA2_10350 [Chryseobacterium sp. IT-36CA2]